MEILLLTANDAGAW